MFRVQQALKLTAVISSVLISQVAVAAQLPLVAIDIGHCAKRPGATSSRGIPEYDFNLNMADVLSRELLSSDGWRAILLKDNACLSLAQRSARANEKNADIFISIHHNSILPKYMSQWKSNGRIYQFCDDFPGYSVYFSSFNKLSKESRRLAETVSSALKNAGFTPHTHPVDELEQKRITLIDSKTGLYEFDELGVLKGTEMPSILIECGMIVDRNEELELRKSERMKKMADAIRRGIKQFWKDRRL